MHMPEPASGTSSESDDSQPGEVPGGVAEHVWEDLRKQARQAMRNAYAPYSGYPVGVAALVDDGRVITGCNVENASYGLGLCAECGLVSQLAATGGGKLIAFSCCDGEGNKLVPCGRCRQLLYEFGGPDLLLDMPSGIQPLSVVLPEAFGPDHLNPQTTQPQP